MNAYRQERRDHPFVIGLLAGTCLGAGLAMWLAPQAASELRQRLSDSARSLGKRASDQYQRAGTRIAGAVDELARKGQGVRDGVADAVARGAHEVEAYATAVKTGPVTETQKHAAADRSGSTQRPL